MLLCNHMEYQPMTNESDQNIEPTPEEIAQAAEVLRRLPKGFLPLEIFHAIAEKVTTPTMEVAPLRVNEAGEVEVLLTKRPDDDPHWPGGWHIPGTVIRATDDEGSLQSGFERVLQKELHGSIPVVDDLQLVSMKFWDVTRGRELDMVHYFETNATDEDVAEGQFFTVDHLPEMTLDHHKIMIPEIVATFREQKGL